MNIEPTERDIQIILGYLNVKGDETSLAPYRETAISIFNKAVRDAVAELLWRNIQQEVYKMSSRTP